MRKFDEIYDLAQARKGGVEELETLIAQPKPPSEIAKLSDDRWLSQFTKSIYSAQFSHVLIDKVWDDFEDVFHGFDVEVCAMLDDAQLEQLAQDKRLWRKGTHARSVRDNALMLLALAEEHGRISDLFADWPPDEFVELMFILRQKGRRLGGLTGPRALCALGIDGFVLTPQLRSRLIVEGVIDKNPKTRDEFQDVQDALNFWSAQSGRSIYEVSQICALSIKSNFKGRQTKFKRFYRGKKAAEFYKIKKRQAAEARMAS